MNDIVRLISNLPWHDTVIKSIVIDRRNPGIVDRLDLHVLWPNYSSGRVVFEECYRVEMAINMAIVAEESILDTLIFLDSDAISSLKKKWLPINADLDELIHTRIETNSTGSIIEIICKRIDVFSDEASLPLR